MTDLRKAAEMALEAMVSFSTGTNKMFEGEFAEEIKELRQALAQQDKECVAIVNEAMGGIEWLSPCLPDDTPLYAAPPKREWVEQERAVGYREGHQAALKQREWVGLMDADIAETMRGNVEGSNMLPYSFARAIEAKLKEKNT